MIMKKQISITLFLILMTALLAACANDQKADDSEQTPAVQATEAAGSAESKEASEATEELEKNEESPEVSNKLFSITLPAKAAGTFVSDTTDNSISIYDKEAKEAEYGGFAFCVSG